jgi:hypothetical protein
MTMNGKTYRADETMPIEVHAIDSDLADLTGLSDVTVNVRNSDTDLFLDWDDLAFKAAGSVTTMNKTCTEVDATNQPGMYGYDLDLTTLASAPTSRERWIIKISGGTGVAYKGAAEVTVEPTTVLDGSEIPGAVWDEAATDHTAAGSLGRRVSLVMGILFGNYSYKPTTRDSNGTPTAWTLKVYASSGDVPATSSDPDGTILGTFTVSAEANSANVGQADFIRAVLAEV